MKTTKITWGNLNYEFYKPKANSLKRLGLFGFVGLCLITPMTNWMLVPAGKLLSKNIGWLYK